MREKGISAEGRMVSDKDCPSLLCLDVCVCVCVCVCVWYMYMCEYMCVGVGGSVGAYHTPHTTHYTPHAAVRQSKAFTSWLLLPSGCWSSDISQGEEVYFLVC